MKGHKWFAAIYDRMTASYERSFLGKVREEICGGLTGKILEIGAGTGANFPHYRDGAEVVATEVVEPSEPAYRFNPALPQ